MFNLGIQAANIEVEFQVGDTVNVVGGVWKDTVGVIQSINQSKQSVTINVELFGRKHRGNQFYRNQKDVTKQRPRRFAAEVGGKPPLIPQGGHEIWQRK